MGNGLDASVLLLLSLKKLKLVARVPQQKFSITGVRESHLYQGNTYITRSG